MTKFLSAPLLAEAVKAISTSAARDRYFEFLMLKRTIMISGVNNVVFAEGEPAYRQAINELGLVSANTKEEFSENRYINVFDTRDSTHGYRSRRFISNGPNTTVGGTAWQSIVKLDSQSRPRKVSLTNDYLIHLPKFLVLKNGSKPNYQAFAAWFCRHIDTKNIIDEEDYSLTKVLQAISEYTDSSFGFTKDEKTALFDISTHFNDSVTDLKEDVVQDELATPNEYLPAIPRKLISEEARQELQPNTTEQKIVFYDPTKSLQKIYFGAPGAGKSRQVSVDTEGMKVFRTTFHPDSEYASFVGAYKPTVTATGITYAFVPQIFSKAYVYAWEHPQEPVVLVIDEINRGNCAQTFGDLFQLLDRNSACFSEYALLADADLAGYIDECVTDKATYAALAGSIDQLRLPPNLFLYATMNTSDQSLFLMDSAFKRRWDWEYVPIDYADADQFTIVLSNDYTYRWGRFIECINRFIVELTGSEDKQLGNRFVNPPNWIITLSMFKSKVLFYLWSEIYKNETDKDQSIFQYQPADAPDTVLFTFSQLYEKDPEGIDRDLTILPSFMRQLGLEPLPNS